MFNLNFDFLFKEPNPRYNVFILKFGGQSQLNNLIKMAVFKVTQF